MTRRNLLSNSIAILCCYGFVGNLLENCSSAFAQNKISTFTSIGSCMIKGENGKVNFWDCARAVEAASAVSIPPGRKIIDGSIARYTVDGQDYDTIPFGIPGKRLEVELLVHIKKWTHLT